MDNNGKSQMYSGTPKDIIKAIRKSIINGSLKDSPQLVIKEIDIKPSVTWCTLLEKRTLLDKYDLLLVYCDGREYDKNVLFEIR